MTNNKTATELLPCPFCGNVHIRCQWDYMADGFQYREITCNDCGATLTNYSAYIEDDCELIEAWNTRFDRSVPRCPKCGKRLHDSDVHGYRYACFECDENFYGFEAIEAQNTRTERTCRVRKMSALEQTLSMVDLGAWGVCSECGCLTPEDSRHCIGCGAKVVSA